VGNASYSAYLGTWLVIEYFIRVLLIPFRNTVPTTLVIRVGLQLTVTFGVLAAGCIAYQFIEWPLLRKLQAKLPRSA
jgi:peptidoglycan/LPS O-acetylase OafA/YrhL